MIEVFNRESQVYGEFNGGEIIENKPIGFPHEEEEVKHILIYFTGLMQKQMLTVQLGYIRIKDLKLCLT